MHMTQHSGRARRVLDILLAIQQEAQEGTQKVLDAISGDRVDDISLELLWTEVGKALREGFGKAGAEHDNELREVN